MRYYSTTLAVNFLREFLFTAITFLGIIEVKKSNGEIGSPGIYNFLLYAIHVSLQYLGLRCGGRRLIELRM